MKRNNNKYIKRVLKSNNCITANEITMSQIIKTIDNYKYFFLPVMSNKELDLASIDDEDFDNFETINKNVYILNEYEYECNDDDYYIFNDFFNRNQTNKKCILNIILSYEYLLKTLLVLERNKIVHLELCPENIVFVNDKKTLIRNFERSFVSDKPHHNLFNEYNPAKIYLPLEVQLICYMNKLKLVSLSYENICFLIEDFNKYLSLSPINNILISNLNKEEQYLSLKHLINKPNDYIMDSLLGTSIYWNNYSLSIMYLIMLSMLNISRDNKFVKNFSHILLLGMKRERIDSIIELFNSMILYIDEKEWNAILN